MDSLGPPVSFSPPSPFPQSPTGGESDQSEKHFPAYGEMHKKMIEMILSATRISWIFSMLRASYDVCHIRITSPPIDMLGSKRRPKWPRFQTFCLSYNGGFILFLCVCGKGNPCSFTYFTLVEITERLWWSSTPGCGRTVGQTWLRNTVLDKRKFRKGGPEGRENPQNDKGTELGKRSYP